MRFVGRPRLWVASAVLSTLQLAAMAGFVFLRAAPFTGAFWLLAAATAAVANGAISGFVRSTTCVVALVLAGAIAITPFVRRTCPFFIDAAPSPLVAGATPVAAAGALALSVRIATASTAITDAPLAAIGVRSFDGRAGGAAAGSTTDERCTMAGAEPTRGNSVSILAALGLATIVPSALAGLFGDGLRLASLGLARRHRRRSPGARPMKG